MTATLSHEIRNALGSVKGYTQWVEEKTDPDDPRKKGLAFALKGAERIESLVNELLLYAREDRCAVGPVEFEPLAETVLREETAGWGGGVETDFGDARRAMADPEKLRRVLSNGIRNAIQAMGGRNDEDLSRAEGKWCGSGSRTPAREPETRRERCSRRSNTQARRTGLVCILGKVVEVRGRPSTSATVRGGRRSGDPPPEGKGGRLAKRTWSSTTTL
jgi:signal transduction histidine kinase